MGLHKVVKPGPDRTVQPETVHQEGFLNSKNRPMQESQWTVPTAIEHFEFQNRKRFLQVRPLKVFFWKFFGTYRLTAIVDGWNFNHHETLSDLRSHPHLPVLLLCLARTLSALSLCVFDDSVSTFFSLD